MLMSTVVVRIWLVSKVLAEPQAQASVGLGSQAIAGDPYFEMSFCDYDDVTIAIAFTLVCTSMDRGQQPVASLRPPTGASG